ncbi:MAG: transcriptional repressor LexA [Rhodothermaceae bacterium]
MKTNLTDRQQTILDFITEFVETNGYPPTYREIGAHFGIASTFGVKRHIDALVKKGYLHIESNSSRSLSIINNSSPPENTSSDNMIEVPVVGRVAAGYPILAVENIEDNVLIDKRFVKSKSNCFGLRVRGDSMINAGIFEGDIVVVNQQSSANNNDIVVAMLGDEATLKRLVKINNRLCLMPENENYPLIEVHNREDFTIIGKLAAVFRFYN